MDPTKKRKLEDNGAATNDAVPPSAPASLTAEDARKLLEPLSKEQLIEILKNAVVSHLDVLEAARAVADQDVANRKLFIRGLGWETTTEGLRTLFSTYGELEEAVVIVDKGTGKSKGYGFITFKHVDGALMALKEPSKRIDGRVTVTQLAAAGNQGGNVNSADVSTRKIYVANVPYDIPGDKLLSVFAQYGEIEEGPLGFDKATGKSRGFALFVYKSAEGAQAALAEPVKMIDGRQVTCKLAIDGKKKPGQSGPVGPGGAGEGHGDGMGMMPPSSMPGSMGGQYGGPGGMGSYGGYSGGLQGPPPLGHMNSSYGGPGLSSMGSQGPSAVGGAGGYGAGMGGSYGGYGGPGSAGYGSGGSGGLGGGSGGLGGPVGGYGGGAGAGAGSSLYKIPPGSAGVPSGGYPNGAQYGFSSAYPSQLNQPAGASPAPRVPPGGGMYPNAPHYY